MTATFGISYATAFLNSISFDFGQYLSHIVVSHDYSWIRYNQTDTLTINTVYAVGGGDHRLFQMMTKTGSVTRKMERKSKKNVTVAFHSLWSDCCTVLMDMQFDV